MGRLKNKIAIVTGAADGIGLAISRAFAMEGAKVIMADINISKCQLEANKLQKENKDVTPLQCDVGVTDHVNRMVENCIANYGTVDILVNNAAVAIGGNVTAMPEEDWDTLMNINLKGAFRCIKACLPHMLKAQSGSVINIASTQAHRSWDGWTAYATAKGGLLAMTNQLAGQYGVANIRLNSISPGTILTPMGLERVKKEGKKFLLASEKQASMKRCGSPQEVAMAAVFLASDEASFVTGEDLIVDGGLMTLPRYIEKD